ncbi:MAG TPA: cytochrome P450 [Acidiphilium sp.]|nr:MAG: cytochrome [Acidiphilium sp. 21-60-14]OYV90895.1 MAG: cytochrome [Acidiphilium sp. 37-60-79]OZB39614.1 MAG: cytochrome [Acidiphilium sp. 34-60-192]HQT88300.1 cytochrome P450 [Acidiphilium sp.]HQU23349.1 cytochrome P450 [Acidiphilium sp.]
MSQRQALIAQADELPLAAIHVGQPLLFQHDAFWPYFARLRREAPVHYCSDSEYGAYWSITKYRHIMQIEAKPEIFSSDVKYGGIAIRDQQLDFTMPMFIAMDPPRHTQQRAAVQPIVGAPSLAALEILIRKRAQGILDGLPIGEDFNWVSQVSIELTTQLLATLFDFPWADRHKLTRWSDVATAVPGGGIVESEEQRRAELLECLQYFLQLWQERAAAPPRGDLISMMAHADATRHQTPMEYLGNLILLIVGGNDTTRNSISGGLFALNQFPDQYTKLLDNPGLVANMVPEIIRWQTPLAHMRRTAVCDTEFEGQKIKEGDRVVLWYVSGNYDEDAIEQADQLVIDRARARKHLSFGFGLHRCLGERLADMQLRIMWEEILRRFGRIEVVSEPERIFSAFVKGYSRLTVRIPADQVKPGFGRH